MEGDGDPGTMLWGKVGGLEFYTDKMRRVTDVYFIRGEHAA